MNPIDIVLWLLLAAAVITVLIYMIRRRRSGKGGCSCGCQGCPKSGICKAGAKDNSPEKNKTE